MSPDSRFPLTGLAVSASPEWRCFNTGKFRNRIRTNNTLERLNREIKRRTKPIGAFPDGNSALMLVCARLRHVAGSDWGIKRYMNMDHLLEMDADLNALQSN